MEKEKILEEIKKLEKEKEAVSGTRCEVYSRVVGYFRPTENWNDGKKEEFSERKGFVIQR